ncbi:ATP-binding protein [Ekhidna sp.]|uniref:HAMP domain-containing sensor histidine kinase n=1 Tax=Ekhidna sp. TaxID=2608089 RepID=UPI0035199423
MKIKTRLVIIFTLILAGINLFAFLLIYVLSANFRKEQFYDRLYEKAINTAKLLVDVEEIDEQLLRIIDENTASLPDEQVIVYDFLNQMVYSNPTIIGDHIDQQLIDKIRLEQKVEFTHNTKDYVGALYISEYDRFVVIASAYDRYGLGKLSYLRTVLLIVFPISLIIVWLSGMVFVSRAFKTVNDIIEEVNQITEKSLSSRLDEGNGKDELANLALTFNRMLNRLENAFATQKGFVSYASHELRTPLTTILGQIEVVLMQERNETEYREVLISVNEELLKLKKLTNGLLRLFQLTSSEAALKPESVRIDEILFLSVEQVRKERDSPIEIIYQDLPEAENEFIIQGNEEMLVLAISNLIENACKYSEGSKVKVILSISSMSLCIDIVDSGIGIEPDEVEKIFEPFFRGSRTSSFRGYGIGLALVKQIILLHNARIEVKNENPGTRMHIDFPRKF